MRATPKGVISLEIENIPQHGVTRPHSLLPVYSGEQNGEGVVEPEEPIHDVVRDYILPPSGIRCCGGECCRRSATNTISDGFSARQASY